MDTPTTDRATSRLQHAVEAWRTADRPAEKLSEGAKSRIFNEITNPTASQRRLTPLFSPTRTWLAAGALSSGVAVLALALVLSMPQAPVESVGGPGAQIQVAKVGDRVVFTIANGGREHVIYRSEVPTAFDADAGVRVSGGRYVDRVESGSNLVFYKID